MVSPAPWFVSVSDDLTIAVQSRHALDPISSAEITVTVTLDSAPSVTASATFTASLVCPAGQLCLTQAQYDSIPDTSPVIDSTPNLLGTVRTDPSEDTWYVKKAFYMLCKVKLYKNRVSTAGFEATFCPYPPEQFPGFPEETHLFGQDDRAPQEITLDMDLRTLQICVDDVEVGGRHSDFEGFKFTEMDDQFT